MEKWTLYQAGTRLTLEFRDIHESRTLGSAFTQLQEGEFRDGNCESYLKKRDVGIDTCFRLTIPKQIVLPQKQPKCRTLNLRPKRNVTVNRIY